jgi:hypothetical protein
MKKYDWFSKNAFGNKPYFIILGLIPFAVLFTNATFVSPSPPSGGGYRVSGLRANSDSGYPTLAMDLSADMVTLLDPVHGGTVTILSPPTIKPSINAADICVQSAPPSCFPTGSTVWFYYIWGSGPGLRGITSLSPPNAGPYLPSGYTHFAPAFPVKLDSTSRLYGYLRILGNKAHYLISDNAFRYAALTPVTLAM